MLQEGYIMRQISRLVASIMRLAGLTDKRQYQEALVIMLGLGRTKNQ